MTPDLTPPVVDGDTAGAGRARWLIPSLAVAVIAAAVGVIAITTSSNGSVPNANRPVSLVSTSAFSTSASSAWDASASGSSTPAASTTASGTTGFSASAPGTTAPVRRSSAVAPATPGTGASGTVPVLLKYGEQQGRAQIPWSQVGRGWFLAAPYSTASAGSALYLVNPIGGRYLITDHLPHARDYVAEWSPDGTRVMLSRQEANGHEVLTELELATGRVLHTFDAGRFASFVSYTRPQGRAILVAHDDGKTYSLQRRGTDGRHQLTYPRTLPGLGKVQGARKSLYSADGAELLVSGEHGTALIGNDGHLIRFLAALPARKDCMPVSWWDSATALVRCTNDAVHDTRYSMPTELFLQPVAGGRPSKLAGGSPATHPFGFVYAWKYSGGVVLREGSGCGPGELDVLRNGVISRLRLPAGVRTPAPVFGFDHDTITVQQHSVCGPTPDQGSVISFNLVTGASTTLFKGTARLTPYPSQ